MPRRHAGTSPRPEAVIARPREGVTSRPRGAVNARRAPARSHPRSAATACHPVTSRHRNGDRSHRHSHIQSARLPLPRSSSLSCSLPPALRSLPLPPSPPPLSPRLAASLECLTAA
eukprot:3938725-Rhodomonas_salina.1